MTLDGWQASELTLAGNQLLSDWKSKQLKWNEEKTEKPEEIRQERMMIELNQDKTQLTIDGVVNADLAPFELKAFKVIKG